MEAFADVWHSAGQAVIMNDHSNRLDMMEFVDGIYAEMGDMDASGKPHRCAGMSELRIQGSCWQAAAVWARSTAMRSARPSPA